jgi:hypothetical protein
MIKVAVRLACQFVRLVHIRRDHCRHDRWSLAAREVSGTLIE